MKLQENLKQFAVGGMQAIKERCEREIASGKWSGKELEEFELTLKEVNEVLEEQDNG